MIDSRFPAALGLHYSFVDYETQRAPTMPPIMTETRRGILGRLGNPHRRAKSVHVAGEGQGKRIRHDRRRPVASGYRTGSTPPASLEFQ